MNEEMEYEIDLLEIFQILKKRWLMIVSLIVVSIGIGFWYTISSYVPMYSASTTVILNRQDVTLGVSSSSDFYLREDLILTFQGIINSQNLRNRVSDELGTTNLGSIQVSADDSSIIRIMVTHTDPKMTVDIANKTAEIFREMIKEMMYDMDSSVLDEALVISSSQGMNLKMNVLIAAVLGGMIGVGLCFVIEFLDQTFKNPEQMTKLIELPVIGVIPAFNHHYNFINEEMNMQTKPSITELDHTSAAESYFMLRTNIKFSMSDKSLKTINVTSPSTGDGKSATCANLAITYAKSGDRVLLIDADLRHPTQHRLFNLSNQEGLTNVILFNKSHKSVIQNVTHNLDVMTAGPLPTNPVGVIGSRGFEKFLKEIRQFYDVVIIDTPPVGVVTDAAIVSTYCDGTLLVVAEGKTPIKLTRQAKQALQNVNANVIGSVMTMSQINTKEHQYCELSKENLIQKIKYWKLSKLGV